MTKNRLPALDALRGGAALAVVLAHWTHFQYGPGGPVSPAPGLLPLWDVLWPFYCHGQWATTLFFSLSGFIFFWLYADRVAERRVSAGEFFWLRLTRLYPLHLVTLLAVAAGQCLWHARTGSYFVYPQNDPRHFALHLALASNWSGRPDWSFNAPVWSVSVEVLLYLAFYALFVLRLRSWWWAAALCTAAVVVPTHRGLLTDGFAAFFAGGLAYRVYAAVTPGRWLVVATAAVAALWVAVPWAVTTGAVPDWYRSLPAPLTLGGRDAGAFAAAAFTRFAPHVLLFPATVAVVAWWDARLAGTRRWAARLGQLSYSSYLLHFPLQMAFAGATDAAGLSRDIYRSPVSLVAFVAVLVPLSLASYRYFERPAQCWLRARTSARFSRPKTAAEPVAPPAKPDAQRSWVAGKLGRRSTLG